MKISVEELKKIIKNKNINLIDIRSKDKYKLGTIANAVNINENDLLYNTSNYLNMNDTYYIFCESGSSSDIIANVLSSLGYKVYSIIGGYKEYIS